VYIVQCGPLELAVYFW